MKKRAIVLAGGLLIVVLVAVFAMCAEASRPDFDSVRIVYQGDIVQEEHLTRMSCDRDVMDALWTVYAALDPVNSNRPMEFPRYQVTFLNEGEEPLHWLINQAGVVACAERWGPGNRFQEGSYTYDAVTAVWEDMAILDSDRVTGITFQVYPQGGPNFTLDRTEDPVVLGQIVEQINALELHAGRSRPEKGTDSYYYLEIVCVDGPISVELDDTSIMLDQKRYDSDCAALCELLTRTCERYAPKI